MTVIRDRTNLHREGRIRARLPLVAAGFDKMKEVIVRPMTRFDDGAALGVPSEAVRIAGAFGEDLEFAGARMDSPHRASESVFLAIVGANMTLIENAIQPVKPAVRSPGE